MSQATVTLPIGAGLASAGIVLTNVSAVNYEFERGILRVTQSSPAKITDFEYSAAVTITMTKSGQNTTVTVTT